MPIGPYSQRFTVTLRGLTLQDFLLDCSDEGGVNEKKFRSGKLKQIVEKHYTELRAKRKKNTQSKFST